MNHSPRNPGHARTVHGRHPVTHQATSGTPADPTLHAQQQLPSLTVPGHDRDEDVPRRASWLDACLAVSARFACNDPEGGTGRLDFIAAQACRGAGCRQALILLPTGREGTFLVAGAAGQGKANAAGQFVFLDPALRNLHSGAVGQALITDGAGVFGQLPGPGTGDILAIALRAQNLSHGLLLLRGAKAPGFTQSDIQMGAYFGSNAALALEMGKSRVLHERDLIYSDRDRIARDLHDAVIQRLFAAGLGIQTLPDLLGREEAVQRVRAITAELDDSIRELRETIYALRPSRSDETMLDEPGLTAGLPATPPSLQALGQPTDIPGSVA